MTKTVASQAAGARLCQPWLVLGLALVATGCASTSVRPYPLRDPLWQDNDLRPIAYTCRAAPEKDDPEHQVCTPEPYVSAFGWDAANNTVFRPLARVFAVEPGEEAINVNAVDEVPDSSWFVNRIGRHAITPEQAAIGPCSGDLKTDMPDGSWVIDRGKTDGATPGFRVKIPKFGKFMLKADFGTQPERPSAASAIGVRLYHAIGFHVACDSVVYFKQSLLKLTSGLKVTDNSGKTRPFDQAALDKVIAVTPHRGDQIRMQSSQWLSGVPLGPFTYDGLREDDPNDVIPHQDRRELRGARLLAAWINHFDAREQNTMSTWVSADEKKPDSSPGYVKHYYLDMSDSLGSEWDWDGISRRLGHSYYLDLHDIGRDFVTFGLVERPWDHASRVPDAKNLGYFPNDDFSAEGWKAGYPNPAFSRMTEHDGAWMTRLIARFTPAMVAAVVKTGQFTNPYHEQLINHALLERRWLILHRYLGRLSPLTDFTAGPDGLCGVDLARQSGVFPEKTFAYQASVRTLDGASRPATVRAAAEGRVCIDVRPEAPDGEAPAPGDRSRYRVVAVQNGQAPGELWAHLYDLGPAKGLRLVGLERPNP